ncbi:hypothetical protein BA190_10055 [Labrys sp. WJW]|uniref:hypothetical protein n=1 Tax=Labrys sp. WJW TaxID=1737983 RepID=UPI0008325AA6|nr:hypothetical protein [Labrys sp. WJW]OCC05237.1 hypothetical protein BA190_10055 [Labrys sp. WJW]
MSIPETSILRIKAATRDLVKVCGGVVRAGEIALLSKSEISRFQAPGSPDLITIPAALALEADCGLPLVTQVMADMSGRRLTDPEAEERQQACLASDISETLRKSAEVMTAYASAIADGVVTAAEAEAIDRVAGELGTNVLSMRRNLAAVKASNIRAAG